MVNKLPPVSDLNSSIILNIEYGQGNGLHGSLVVGENSFTDAIHMNNAVEMIQWFLPPFPSRNHLSFNKLYRWLNGTVNSVDCFTFGIEKSLYGLISNSKEHFN